MSGESLSERVKRLEALLAAWRKEDEKLRQKISQWVFRFEKQIDALETAVSRSEERVALNSERIQMMRELLQSFEMTMHVLVNRKPGTDPVKEATRLLVENQRKWASHLGRMMSEYFNEAELHALVYDLGWDYESFSGDNKVEKIAAITDYARRRKTLQLLAGSCQEARPGVQWPLFSADV